MTKETIIKSTLKYLVKRQIEEGSVGFAVDNDHDHDCCWDDVLAWIEAQPSEDAVSREAVKALIKRLSFKYYMECGEYIGEDSREVTLINALKFEECFEDLPPVKPKYTDEEIDRAQAVEQAYVDKMVELAVAETKRPKGKWVLSGGYWRCSRCKEKALLKFDKSNGGCKEYMPIKSNYCPNCGSYNGGNDNGDE